MNMSHPRDEESPEAKAPCQAGPSRITRSTTKKVKVDTGFSLRDMKEKLATMNPAIDSAAQSYNSQSAREGGAFKANYVDGKIVVDGRVIGSDYESNTDEDEHVGHADVSGEEDDGPSLADNAGHVHHNSAYETSAYAEASMVADSSESDSDEERIARARSTPLTSRSACAPVREKLLKDRRTYTSFKRYPMGQLPEGQETELALLTLLRNVLYDVHPERHYKMKVVNRVLVVFREEETPDETLVDDHVAPGRKEAGRYVHFTPREPIVDVTPDPVCEIPQPDDVYSGTIYVPTYAGISGKYFNVTLKNSFKEEGPSKLVTRYVYEMKKYPIMSMSYDFAKAEFRDEPCKD